MSEHPLQPGTSSAIEKGPWHYGADYVAVYFTSDTSRLQKLLPSPFKVDGGRCIAYICEIVSVADNAKDLLSTRPDRTLYHEAAVGVQCRAGKKIGVFYPVMWVTTEWSLLRGILNGYQKRLADRISMTKLHPLNPGLGPISKGTEFGGFCVKGPDTTMALSVRVERAGAPKDLPSFGATFGLRKFPATEESQDEVDQPVEILKSNSRISDVWLGSGTIETILEVGDITKVSGATYRSGFTISGSKPLG